MSHNFRNECRLMVLSVGEVVITSAIKYWLVDVLSHYTTIHKTEPNVTSPVTIVWSEKEVCIRNRVAVAVYIAYAMNQALITCHPHFVRAAVFLMFHFQTFSNQCYKDNSVRSSTLVSSGGLAATSYVRPPLSFHLIDNNVVIYCLSGVS